MGTGVGWGEGEAVGCGEGLGLGWGVGGVVGPGEDVGESDGALWIFTRKMGEEDAFVGRDVRECTWLSIGTGSGSAVVARGGGSGGPVTVPNTYLIVVLYVDLAPYDGISGDLDVATNVRVASNVERPGMWIEFTYGEMRVMDRSLSWVICLILLIPSIIPLL